MYAHVVDKIICNNIPTEIIKKKNDKKFISTTKTRAKRLLLFFFNLLIEPMASIPTWSVGMHTYTAAIDLWNKLFVMDVYNYPAIIIIIVYLL